MKTKFIKVWASDDQEYIVNLACISLVAFEQSGEVDGNELIGASINVLGVAAPIRLDAQQAQYVLNHLPILDD